MTPWLLLLPLLAGLLLAAESRSRRLLRHCRLAPRSLPRLAADALALVALGLALLATRPAPPSATRPGGLAVAVAVDVSASMNAADVLPTRLQRARAEVGALLDALPDARFALVPFAGEAVLQVPLTADHEALRFFLDGLDSSTLAVPGSAPQEALLAAHRALADATGARAIVLLSDFERTRSEAPPTLPDDIPVYLVPLGSDTGASVPGHSDLGQPARSRLDRTTLHSMATFCDGTILPVAADVLAARLQPNPPPSAALLLPWRLLVPALLLLLLRQAWGSRWRWPAAMAVGLTVTLGLVSCQRDLYNGAEAVFRQASEKARAGDFTAAAAAFNRAAALLEGNRRSAALYDHGTALLLAGQPQAALAPLQQALLLQPGEADIRRNLALALRRSRNLPGQGAGEEAPGGQESDDDQAPSRLQALELLQSVRPLAGAPPTATGRVRELRPGRDW